MDVVKTYIIDGKEYPCLIKRMKMKRVIVRINDDLTFEVHAPRSVKQSQIDQFVLKAGPSLLKKKLALKEKDAYQDGYLYLFGKKEYVGPLEQKQLKSLLRKTCLPYYESRLRYFENLMGVKQPYNLKVRSMKTRFGVNSKKNHTITIQLELISYSPEIIDSVIAHEVTHHFVMNHSKNFYAILLKYVPDYWECRKKLLNRIYE